MTIRSKSDESLSGHMLCCATAVRKASRRISQMYDDALEPAGLRSTQFAILAELASHAEAPPTMAELAAALVTDRSGLGHNLRPLERDGLIALKASETDGRRRHVVLTARGRDRLKACLPLWQAAQDRFVQVLGAAETTQLRRSLLAIAGDERLGALTE